jgi:hypothetical protein
MRKNGVTYRNMPFSYNDSDPVTIQSLTGTLGFLCQLAEMHIKGLARIKEGLGGRAWLLHFRRVYCIRARDGARVEEPGGLLLENMLESHIKFLRHQGGISPWEFLEESNAQLWFRRLLSVFRKDVSSLEKGSVDLATVSALRYEEQIKLPELAQQAAKKRA